MLVPVATGAGEQRFDVFVYTDADAIRIGSALGARFIFRELIPSYEVIAQDFIARSHTAHSVVRRIVRTAKRRFL